MKETVLKWRLHHHSANGILCIQADNTSDRTLNNVLLRVRSKLSSYSRSDQGMTFTLYLPKWKPSHSVLLSPDLVARLKLPAKPRRGNASRPKPIPPHSFIAALHCDDGAFVPHDIDLTVNWNQAECVDENISRLPLTSRPTATLSLR
jgi:hypothetical protein